MTPCPKCNGQTHVALATADRKVRVLTFVCDDCGHEFTRGAWSLCVARRLSRRDLDVFFLGTAIGRRV